jgi:hypothetical protein
MLGLKSTCARGGFTPEMISAARGQSLYQAWADVIAYGE